MEKKLFRCDVTMQYPCVSVIEFLFTHNLTNCSELHSSRNHQKIWVLCKVTGPDTNHSCLGTQHHFVKIYHYLFLLISKTTDICWWIIWVGQNILWTKEAGMTGNHIVKIWHFYFSVQRMHHMKVLTLTFLKNLNLIFVFFLILCINNTQILTFFFILWIQYFWLIVWSVFKVRDLKLF